MYRVFTINPGSTSTKIALFEDDKKVFAENVSHDVGELKACGSIPGQLPYRKQIIMDKLDKKGINLEDIDCFAGRGGGLPPMHAGVFEVNEKMCKDAEQGKGVLHPGLLGPLLAYDFQKQYGGMAVVVNPPGVDELQPLARITGLKDVYRISRVHALNQKEIGIRYASDIGRSYEDLNLVISHMGGGISVTAHEKGKMIDNVDITNGDGHMAPTRSGFVPATSLIKLCFSGEYTREQLHDRITLSGGWVDHLGTSDAKEVMRRVESGDEYAKLILDATAYQIAKDIGAYATVLKGNVDAIILTGGLAYLDYFVNFIRDMVEYIAPVIVMPGEAEMEALAAGAVRVLSGKEKIREYTGEPVWTGFHFETAGI